MAEPLHTDLGITLLSVSRFGIAFKFLSLIFWIEKTRDLWVIDFDNFCGTIALLICICGCREGLSTRNAAGSEEIQLRIDPMHSDLDDEITGLHGQVRQLKNIAQEIGSEAKFQRDFLDELQMTLIRAQAGVKNNIRKLNLSIIRSGNNHIMHVVLFALLLFFILYMWSKMFKR
jgi:hypothetical protein